MNGWQNLKKISELPNSLPLKLISEMCIATTIMIFPPLLLPNHIKLPRIVFGQWPTFTSYLLAILHHTAVIVSIAELQPTQTCEKSGLFL